MIDTLVDALKVIGNPFALIAFIAIIYYLIKLNNSSKEVKIIQSGDAGKKNKMAEIMIERYKIDTSKLSEGMKYKLITKQLNHDIIKYIFLITAAIIAIILLFILSNKVSTPLPSDKVESQNPNYPTADHENVRDEQANGHHSEIEGKKETKLFNPPSVINISGEEKLILEVYKNYSQNLARYFSLENDLCIKYYKSEGFLNALVCPVKIISYEYYSYVYRKEINIVNKDSKKVNRIQKASKERIGQIIAGLEELKKNKKYIDGKNYKSFIEKVEIYVDDLDLIIESISDPVEKKELNTKRDEIFELVREVTFK